MKLEDIVNEFKRLQLENNDLRDYVNQIAEKISKIYDEKLRRIYDRLNKLEEYNPDKEIKIVDVSLSKLQNVVSRFRQAYDDLITELTKLKG